MPIISSFGGGSIRGFRGSEVSGPTPFSAGNYDLNNLLQTRVDIDLPNGYSHDVAGNFVSPDRLNYYFADSAGNVTQFKMSTPHDITTMTFERRIGGFGSGGRRAFTLSSIGHRLYIVAEVSRVVTVYELSTPWNIGTASEIYIFTLEQQGNELYPHAQRFSPDGSIYVVQEYTESPNLKAYDLGTPWDPRTRNLRSEATHQVNIVRNMGLSDDGTVVALVNGNDVVHFFDMTTPWQPSSLTNFDFKPEFAGGPNFSITNCCISGEYLYVGTGVKLNQYTNIV